jgi:glycosyltransferase involved in cell wall biosynthesis
MEQSLLGKRVAVVCGHFSPEVGYQEVDLARAFTRIGAQVRVVTSTRLSPNGRMLTRADYPPGVAQFEGYEVIRLSPRLTIGPNLIGCSTFKSVSEFSPDFVVLVGPGKLFGIDLFKSARSPWKRVAIVQDNSDDGRARNATKPGARWRAAAHHFVKRPVYRRVVRHADRIVLNVPETRSLIQGWLRGSEKDQLQTKGLELRLGFDPERFYFDRDERRAWRSAHGVGDDEVLLATCTRATPSKRLESVIDIVADLCKSGYSLRYAIAGLLEDDYAERLRAHAQTQVDPEAYLMLPALDHHEMRDLFCAADLGYWPRPAITIQQAMGTGLPVVLEDRPNVRGLLRTGRNGWYAQSGGCIDQALSDALETLPTLPRRETIASDNREYLAYDAIATAMLAGLG